MSSAPESTPVIAIDGLAASGKGTVASRVAQQLQLHLLDSGLLYRTTAYLIDLNRFDVANVEQIARYIDSVTFECEDTGIYVSPEGKPRVLILSDSQRRGVVRVGNRDVTKQVRSGRISTLAAKIAVEPEIRKVLIPKQRQRKIPPGLVADGRDMGTVVFPEAELKIFLEASANERTRRRMGQMGLLYSEEEFLKLKTELEERDRQDVERKIAPAKPAVDAITIDNTNQSIPETVEAVIARVRERNLASGVS